MGVVPSFGRYGTAQIIKMQHHGTVFCGCGLHFRLPPGKSRLSHESRGNSGYCCALAASPERIDRQLALLGEERKTGACCATFSRRSAGEPRKAFTQRSICATRRLLPLLEDIPHSLTHTHTSLFLAYYDHPRIRGKTHHCQIASS